MGKNKIRKDQFAEREAQKYEHPIASREFILDLLEEVGQPLTFRKLAKELEITDESGQEALRRRLIAMVRDGQLLQNRRGAFGLVNKMELIAGYVIGHKEGYGFVKPEGGGDDLFLTARQMRMVFPQDKVLVRVINIDQRGRREAIIVDVLERHTQELVGRYFNESGVSFVTPSNQRISQDIAIRPGATLGAKHGQVVLVKITDQPSNTTRPIGEVIQILGDHMAPGMEIDVAIHNHDLPHEWSEATLREAERFPPTVLPAECAGRKDLRHLPLVTIDGEDAKDFDDAVYCEKHPEGGWTLYVAIADVSHYVKPGTSIDREALERGNSVYFPLRVIPMLPESLSNELCSLKPLVDRLSMVCEMRISTRGDITHYQFYPAVICSQARLTYNQVFAMIRQDDASLKTKFAKLVPHLQELFTLYEVLHTARVKRGTIDFDLPESKIIFGEGRKIEKIIALERNDAHRLIEECMLCANISAARYLLQHKVPALYRVHEGPNQEKLNDLRKFLNELGLKLPGGEQPTPGDYASLLHSVMDRPDAHLIQTILLRSLSQAIYSPDNKGHFGLAYDAYAHFTSPIRRYPDLLVHRAIRHVLSGKYQPGVVDPLMEKHGDHCSMTERRADDATREAIDWLKCEFMQDKVGEDFAGVISGVTSFGLFVELKDIYVEGLVHISMLRNDYYQFDPIRRALLGERTGKRYRLGDVVHVKVARVDLDEREIDFVIIDELVEKTKGKKSKAAKAKKQSRNKKSP